MFRVGCPAATRAPSTAPYYERGTGFTGPPAGTSSRLDDVDRYLYAWDDLLCELTR